MTRQMFCAYRREDAASRGLTGGFGIGPGVSPSLAIGAYRSAGLATCNAPSPQRIDIRLRMAPLLVASSSLALNLNCSLCLYSGTHKKTEPEANASDSVS